MVIQIIPDIINIVVGILFPFNKKFKGLNIANFSISTYQMFFVEYFWLDESPVFVGIVAKKKHIKLLEHFTMNNTNAFSNLGLLLNLHL